MKRKSDCPISFSLEHFGDKWSLLIIRDMMFQGKRHYNEFFEGEEKISTSVLGDKLKSLEAGGIITKGLDSVKKSRIRYSLTKKGIALLPTMLDLIIWSSDIDKSTSVGDKFIEQVKENREELIEQLGANLVAAHLK